MTIAPKGDLTWGLPDKKTEMPDEIWVNDFGGYYLKRKGDEQQAQECELTSYIREDIHKALLARCEKLDLALGCLIALCEEDRGEDYPLVVKAKQTLKGGEHE